MQLLRWGCSQRYTNAARWPGQLPDMGAVVTSGCLCTTGKIMSPQQDPFLKSPVPSLYSPKSSQQPEQLPQSLHPSHATGPSSPFIYSVQSLWLILPNVCNFIKEQMWMPWQVGGQPESKRVTVGTSTPAKAVGWVYFRVNYSRVNIPLGRHLHVWIFGSRFAALGSYLPQSPPPCTSPLHLCVDVPFVCYICVAATQEFYMLAKLVYFIFLAPNGDCVVFQILKWANPQSLYVGTSLKIVIMWKTWKNQLSWGTGFIPIIHLSCFKH